MRRHTVAVVSVDDLMKIGHRCAWKDCTNHYHGNVLPYDWRWLAVWWGPPAAPPWADSNVEDRDAVLCPKHAKQLDSLLEEIR